MGRHVNQRVRYVMSFSSPDSISFYIEFNSCNGFTPVNNLQFQSAERVTDIQHKTVFKVHLAFAYKYLTTSNADIGFEP